MQYIRQVRQLPLLTIIIAGLALGLAPAYGWWPAAFVGVIATIGAVERAPSYQRAILIGFTIGLIRSMIAIGWFWSVYPMNWMGISSPTLQLALVGTYWFLASLCLASGFGWLAVVIRWLRAVAGSWQLILLPAAWVAAEAFGAFAFSVASYGPGARIGADFSFGYIGYAGVTHAALFWLARFGGVWTLSLGLVFVAVLLERTYRTKRPLTVAIILVCILVSWLAWFRSPVPAVTQTVALVDTHFLSDTRVIGYQFREAQVVGAVAAALTTKADTIVLPEDSRFTLAFADPHAALQFITARAKHPVVVVDSARVRVGDHVVLRAFIYDTHANTYYTFDKQYLVPQGELEPDLTRFIARHVNLGAQAESILTDTAYEPGRPEWTVPLPAYVPSVIFCFESVTPYGIRMADRGRVAVPFVAHVVSHDWFNGQPTLLNRSLDAMLLVQAAWNRLPIYLAGNDAPIKRYLPDGQIGMPVPTISTPYWSVTIVPKT